MAQRTNAIRIVMQAGIPCSESYYEYDEKDLSGIHAAHALGFPPDQVYKTLVTRGAKTGIHVFCIPVSAELDLKKAAKVVNDKSISLVPAKELLNLTGYIRGGCSPVGMKKKYPTHFHDECICFDKIAVSAGERGHQMILAPKALAELITADFHDLII